MLVGTNVGKACDVHPCGIIACVEGMRTVDVHEDAGFGIAFSMAVPGNMRSGIHDLTGTSSVRQLTRDHGTGNAGTHYEEPRSIRHSLNAFSGTVSRGQKSTPHE